ncbi:flagellin [Priestia megaterium]|uniref:flagellin N-terminal helical domain-containing protein n=1 Tax=Priestia megaterium TaxID=1404 RepID=UPI000BFE2327|nr:flagellin [Priestia megaterium]PGY51843.1 flagellin [Priestia megaterium]
MRINHNITALNTYRQYNTANNAQAKSMEKLSSGQRINSAADDAAGLAISEKMRGQIRGLDQASRNAQDGVSLIQTAEGALSETTDILQRMRELAVQASSDTNTSDDRRALNDEVKQLKEEVNRISDKTTFNTQKLLDGNLGAQVAKTSNALNATGIESIQTSGGIKAGTYTITEDSGEYSLEDSDGNVLAKATDSNEAGTIDFKQVDTQGNSTGITLVSVSKDSSYVTGSLATDTSGSETNTIKISGSQSQFQIGANKDDTISLSINNMSTTGLNIEDVSVDTFDNAQNALESLDSAIKSVSSERSKLGAYQNRLDHTINNLSTSSENLTASESRIRDVDYALAA